MAEKLPYEKFPYVGIYVQMEVAVQGGPTRGVNAIRAKFGEKAYLSRETVERIADGQMNGHSYIDPQEAREALVGFDEFSIPAQ